MAISGTLIVGSVPTVAVTDNTASTAGVFRSGNTVFFRSSTAGSVILTATGTDSGSTIASNTFGALTGTPTGWSPSALQTNAANPFAVTYTRTASAASTSTSITSRNANSVDSSPVVVTFTPDAAAPILAFTAPPTGGPAIQPGTSYTVIFNATDAASGMTKTGAGWSLQRESAPATSGACGTFTPDGSPVTGQTSATGQSSVQTLTTNTCYHWILSATDSVGNAATAVTSGSVLVDTSAPAAPTITDSAPAGSFRTGNTIFFRPNAAGTVALTSTGTDAGSAQRRAAGPTRPARSLATRPQRA